MLDKWCLSQIYTYLQAAAVLESDYASAQKGDLYFGKKNVKNQLIESWFSDNILLDRQFTVMLEKSCLLTFLINKMGIILAKAI